MKNLILPLFILLSTHASFAIELKDIPNRETTKIEQALAAEAFFTMVECLQETIKFRKDHNLEENLLSIGDHLDCQRKAISYYTDNMPKSTKAKKK